MNLTTEILSLIHSKREDSYWDFKREPHSDLASLLHDIICLANSSHKGTRYLIIGVENNTAKIKGLTPNQKNRKTQAQFIDFLSKLPFAGQNRPEIELRTLIIEENDIDILLIFNNPLKPYFLTQDYKSNLANGKPKIVKANHIYTRVNDTNTPLDKSADIGRIEKMWKERFGLDITPLEKMKRLLLEPENWNKDIGNKSYAYHIEFPEFKIELSKTRPFWEIFSYFFPNENSYLGDAKFVYHSTTLFELEYMFCDEFRLELSVPKSEYIKLGNEQNWYWYYDLSQLHGKFLWFLSDKLTRLSSRGSEIPFLISRDIEERESFNEYVRANENLLFKLEPSYRAENAKKLMIRNSKPFTMDPVFMDRVQQLKEKWDWGGA